MSAVLGLTVTSAPASDRVSAALASVALAVPMLVAVHLPPHITLFNLAAALFGWGCWLAWLVATMPVCPAARTVGLASFHTALALLAVCAAIAPLWAGLPWSLALQSVGLLAAAALAAQTGASMRAAGRGTEAFHALCVGLAVAAAASGIVGIVQVFAPTLTGNAWLAAMDTVGRAVGNMHQPNHLASQMVWGVVAAVWLGERGALRRRVVELLVAAFVFVVVLSVSRTGAVCLLLLAAWGGLDKRLTRSARVLLLMLPLLYLVFWLATSAWAAFTHQLFGGATRFAGDGELVASGRWGMWRNAVAMISAHPWAGVGWSELNFAWTLTAFNQRPQEYFGHAHNLVLQLAVEIGLPLTAVVVGLLGRALWAVVAGARAASPAGAGAVDRAALMLLVVIGFHSLLEYPLWHAYFLLPAAFVLGICAGPRAGGEAAPPAPPLAAGRRGGTKPLFVGALLLAMAGPLVVVDYLPVAAIDPAQGAAAPPAERVARARRSLLFSHLADGVLALRADTPREALPFLVRGPHEFIDAPLLQAWAEALNAVGDTERARYLAQRLKEFRNESAVFFAPCAVQAEPTSPPSARPFQCSPPARAFRFEDFR